MIKGIIFDLDGVLCSTDNFHYLAWKEMADKEGIYFDREINNQLRGVSRMASLEIILKNATKKYSQEEKEELATLKNDLYRKYLTKLRPSDVDPDVSYTLMMLEKRGYKLAIGSSSKNTKLILKNLDLTRYFNVIVDGTMITNSKPDPEVFDKARVLLGFDKDECVVVEDAVSGIDAGYNAGMRTFAIKDAKNNEKATFKIDKLSDILKVIDSI